MDEPGQSGLGRIVCIGGATLDRSYRSRAALRMGTSNPVDGRRGFGGVARNVAENLARLGVATCLLSIVGDDENGHALIGHLRQCGVDTGMVIVDPGPRTAEYLAILEPDGDLALGLADMAVLDRISPDDLERNWPQLSNAAWVFADCNLRAEVLARLTARRAGFRLAVNAVSGPKAARLPANLAGIDLLFVNRDEAASYLAATGRAPCPDPDDVARALFEAGAGQVVLTLGADGLVVANAAGVARVAAVPARSVDVTGAGDSMVAAILYSSLRGDPIIAAARIGALLAALTTETEASVHPELSPGLLDSLMYRLAAEEV